MKRRIMPLTAAVFAVVIVCMMWVDRDVATMYARVHSIPSAPAEFLADLGRPTGYLLVAMVVFPIAVWRKAWLWARRSAMIIVTIAASGLFVNVIKIAAGRARPLLFRATGAYEFRFFEVGYDYASFPSGHAFTIAAVCWALGLFLPRFRVFWLALALGVGWSRLRTGSHFLSDVIAGFYLGVLTTMLVQIVFERWGMPIQSDAPATYFFQRWRPNATSSSDAPLE